MRLQAAEIVSFTKGYLISGDPDFFFTGISTDSRTISKGDLFIALRGDNFDGHDFLDKAFEKGAAGAVVMEDDLSCQGFMVLAEDTLVALGDIAARLRDRYTLPVVGITGSTGKTTVKEFCASILSQEGTCLKTQKNYNNLIGVPLSLIGLSKDHEFAVIEMGTNRFGEIDRLSSITRPTVSILTNINPVHLNGLRNISGIIKEKQAIFKNTQISGTAIINPYLQHMDKVRIPEHLNVITFSIKEKADITLQEILHQGMDGSDIVIDLAGKTVSAHVPLPGMHNVSNALAAAACGVALKIDPEKIVRGINNARFPGMRSEIIVSDRITIINDCYNANPASMKAALEMLTASPQTYKAAVLGDMLELGNDSRYWHEQLGKWVAQSGIDRLIVIGEMADIISNTACEEGMEPTGIHVAQNMDDIFWHLSDVVYKDSVVLVKASRALHLDQVVNHLKAVA